MFDQFIKAWTDLETRLPGFTYVTGAFLILIALGYTIIRYFGIDYWWLIIPGFLLILLFTLFLWLVLSIVNGPATPDTAFMRGFLIRFVVFLFVGFVISGLSLGSSLLIWHKPDLVWSLCCEKLVANAPNARDLVLVREILHSPLPSAGDRANHAILTDELAADNFLQRYACPYCKVRGYPSECKPDYSEDTCAFYATVAAQVAATPLADPRTAVAHIDFLRTAITLPAREASPQSACMGKSLAAVTDPGRILGIDISHSDQNIAWGELSKNNVYFVYLKASQGSRFIDPAFLQRWEEAAKQGLIRGAYHVLDTSPVDKQVALFLHMLSLAKLGPCDVGVALDIEPTLMRGNPPQIAQAAAQWLGLVSQAVKAPPVVYMSQSTAQQIGGLAGLARYPLWYGNLSPLTPASAPAPFQSYRYQQFTYGLGAGALPGVPYDTSLFNGSRDDFLRLVSEE